MIKIILLKIIIFIYVFMSKFVDSYKYLTACVSFITDGVYEDCFQGNTVIMM